MQTARAVDSGDIIRIERTPIEDGEGTISLLDRLSKIGAKALLDALCDIEKGVATFTPQDHEKATFCKMLTKQDSIIDWSLPAQTIVNRIRAFDYMGSSTTKNGELIKIYSAIVTDGVGEAGEVIEADAKTGVKVACGEKAIIIGQMLTAGGKRTLSTDAVKGRKISLGDILGK